MLLLTVNYLSKKFIKLRRVKECQKHYDNLYELIRNVRTLDRIRKNFPDVDLYLPEKYFKTVEDKKKEESLQEKFAKL